MIPKIAPYQPGFYVNNQIKNVNTQNFSSERVSFTAAVRLDKAGNKAINKLHSFISNIKNVTEEISMEHNTSNTIQELYNNLYVKADMASVGKIKFMDISNINGNNLKVHFDKNKLSKMFVENNNLLCCEIQQNQQTFWKNLFKGKQYSVLNTQDSNIAKVSNILQDFAKDLDKIIFS